MKILLYTIILFSCLVPSKREIYVEKEINKYYLILDDELLNSVKEDENQEFNIIDSEQDLYIVESNLIQKDIISDHAHEKFNRCGGFTSHTSLDEARNEVSKVLDSRGLNFQMIENQIDQGSIVNPMVAKVQSSKIENYIEELSSFYTRYYRSNYGVDSTEWILKTWRNLLKSRDDAEVALFHHSWNQPSVYAKIKGSSDDIIVIGGHLDSKNYSQTTGLAPGADDDASGIAVITEVMRVLVDSNYQPDHTLVFVGYAGEEDGLLGSRDFVKDVFNTGENILGVLQIDMVLHNAGPNDQIVLIGDYTNQSQNDFVEDLISTYTSASSIMGECKYGCSDHASWNHPQHGFLASFPFEGNPLNPSIHTVNDTIKSSSDFAHAVHFAKLGVSFMVEVDK